MATFPAPRPYQIPYLSTNPYLPRTPMYIWPVPGHGTITSGVGPRWGRSHNGIDIAAPQGATVVATRNGKVTEAAITCSHNYGKSVGTDSCAGGFGNYINIDHQDGIITRYAHLTSIDVSPGDYVTQGQKIGTVGSTGNSTGFHLHFEFRQGSKYGTVLDPERFVSFDGSVVPPSDPTGNTDSTESTSTTTPTGSIPEGYTSTSRILYNPLTIVGERVSKISQPMTAYVKIYIGDKDMSPLPNMIQSFEITRLKGIGDTATFTVFDDTWIEIEKDFAANWNNIFLEYGYANSEKLVSNRYTMQLTNYNLSFNSSGTLLTTSAISKSATSSLQPTNISTGTKNPTEAVKAICRAMGWTVLDSNFDASNDVSDRSMDYAVINESAIEYILNTITVEASASGEIFEFYLDTNNIAYFKKDVIDTDADVRTYIYMKGYDSDVLDLTFDIKGVFGGTSRFLTSSGHKTSVFDMNTKEEISIEENIETVATQATGEYSHLDPNQSITSVDSAGYSPTQSRNKLYYSVKKAFTSQYEATLTIVGDPTIQLLEHIRIINVTDDGYLHHTSGIYQILGIIDSIENGEMKSVLKLHRSGDINEGVTIISPKALIK